VTIRPEKPDDVAEVEVVVRAAFGGDDEVRLTRGLRDSPDLVCSLVAEIDAQVVGHVMVSWMKTPVGSAGLAPLAVDRKAQGQGVGTALTKAAIAAATSAGCHAMFVLGDPQYYERFGFRVDLATKFTGRCAGSHLMLHPLSGESIPAHGPVDYAAAFDELN